MIGNETIGEQKEKIKLIRGQRGSYGWEITIHIDEDDNSVERLKKLDKTLKETFGGKVDMNS